MRKGRLPWQHYIFHPLLPFTIPCSPVLKRDIARPAYGNHDRLMHRPRLFPPVLRRRKSWGGGGLRGRGTCVHVYCTAWWLLLITRGEVYCTSTVHLFFIIDWFNENITRFQRMCTSSCRFRSRVFWQCRNDCNHALDILSVGRRPYLEIIVNSAQMKEIRNI